MARTYICPFAFDNEGKALLFCAVAPFFAGFLF